MVCSHQAKGKSESDVTSSWLLLISMIPITPSNGKHQLTFFIHFDLRLVWNGPEDCIYILNYATLLSGNVKQLIVLNQWC